MNLSRNYYSLKKFSLQIQTIRNLSSLKQLLSEKIEEKRSAVAQFRQKHGEQLVSQVSINQLYGGMRGCKAFIWETSELDPERGIKYRDHFLPELEKLLPTASGGKQPLPEGVFWLLLTGELPTKEDVNELSTDLAERSQVPEYVENMIQNFPTSVHPMTQLSCAIAAMNGDSQLTRGLASGLKKNRYWEAVYEDALNIIGRIPVVAAMVYNHNYSGDLSYEAEKDKDWSENFVNMIGFYDNEFTELMRLHFTLHADHEGGNVSAHTTHLVSSALSDPYISWSAGLNGLAGPLHGLASQEVLVFINKLKDSLGESPSDENVKKYLLKHLKSGKVIPGFGHAVLRKTDPRYLWQRNFALQNLPDDPLFKIATQLYTICPKVLAELGKVKNPWPNVDAHSGILLQHYGMREMNFYTVLFGISRTLGVMASMIWSRALGMPIERPKTVTTDSLMKDLKFKLPSGQEIRATKSF